ncbi:FxLD family lanthipeptide [Nonomuraea fuscirosea]
MSARTQTNPRTHEFDLDVKLVETGTAAAALNCSTDNGCDTNAGGDC